MYTRVTVRTLVRVISFSLAAVLLAFGFLIQSRQEALLWRRGLENNYTRAMGELSANLSSIATDLEKLRYSGTATQMSRLSARILKESGGAKSALGTLPTGEAPLESAYRFLSQAGDFAVILAGRMIDQTPLTPEEQANALALSKTAVSLRDAVDDSIWKYQSGQLSSRKMIEGDGGAAAVGKGFENLDETITGYPTLIYDGPFSDHLLNREPTMLAHTRLISQAEALKIAANAAQVTPESMQRKDDENSVMASHVYHSGDITLGVTKRGGYVSYLLDGRSLGEERLRQDAVFQRALEFLQRIGMEHMQITYFEKSDGICTLNFAAIQDGIRLYPDLVKVGVALDDGSIVFYDARGYLMNHQQRTLEATILESEARKVVNPLLEVRSSRLALIPTSGQNEVLTYEFRCRDTTDQKTEVLVYINAQTGREENLLMLVTTPGGTLTK